MTLSEKIKTLRLERGMTLEQVGDIVGVGKSTVRKWETGMIENMRRDKVAKLAVALGTSPSFLMGWSDEDADKKNDIFAEINARMKKDKDFVNTIKTLLELSPEQYESIKQLLRAFSQK